MSEKNDRVTHLPRGGVRVETKAGPIQFGIPPETIKDSMILDLPIPTHYVIPRIRFNRRLGINTAEFEFPAYFNFFILKKQVNLITDPEGENVIRRVFQETLFGPAEIDTSEEFAKSVPRSSRPDLVKECSHFRKNPFKQDELMQIDTLLSFTHFSDKTAKIEDGLEVREDEEAGEYVVVEDGEELARVPFEVKLPSIHVTDVQRTFEPPLFGVTILGFSHGFDPKGKTTGFVLWINRRGIMVDPPINSGMLLRLNGIPSRLIDGVIVTHCHADHDAGTFQKILEESRISVMTTPTILGSFLRKYSALSGLEEDELRRLFVYRPIRLGEPVKHHGGELRFFYSLHSIPSIGLEVYFGGKSFVFSGDTLNDPERIQAMHEAGVLSAGRRDFLINFPWHHTVILHEAGVPPLHTPTATLEALPDDVKERLYTVHIAEKDLPVDTGLKIARAGVENTIRIEVTPPDHSEAIEILDLIGSIDLFRNFNIAKSREVLQMARRRRFSVGETIIEKGERGDAFFVIASGVASVTAANGESKNYTTGDYFGETSLVTDQPRNATIKAVTDCEVLALERYDFLYLLRGTNIVERMRHLDRMRQQRSWDVLGANSVLRTLTAAQKTQLQGFMRKRSFEPGEVLWKRGDAATEAILIDEGSVTLDLADEQEFRPFTQGSFIGDINALRRGADYGYQVEAKDAGTLFSFAREELLDFFERNPGVQLAFLNTRFVE